VVVQVKLWNPLTTRVIPERFCGGDSLWTVAISSVCTFTLPSVCTFQSINQLNFRYTLPIKSSRTEVTHAFGKWSMITYEIFKCINAAM